jgi:hypothetical protein
MALTTFAAVLPQRVADIVQDLLQGQWRPQAKEQRDWWNGYAKPAFDTFVAAGIDPAAAVQLVLGGNIRPGEVKRLVLEVAGSAHQIVERKEGTEMRASLGFMGAVSVSLSGARTMEQNTTQTSEAASRLTIETGPAATPEFTQALLQALVANPTAGLPKLPDLPEL